MRKRQQEVGQNQVKIYKESNDLTGNHTTSKNYTVRRQWNAMTLDFHFLSFRSFGRKKRKREEKDSKKNRQN